MKMLQVAGMLLACTDASQLESQSNHHSHKLVLEDKETKLSQSFANAFQMAPPKLMTTKPLPGAGKGGCPAEAKKLTYSGSGGAFIDGCYMNSTRKAERNEATGEEAQHYLYMWKHACAYTKWVPSNQFMYSNLDYDESTMTLERFGFIGMEKRCFWGSIGVLWKRPLPVDQILPNNTIPTDTGPVPVKPPTPPKVPTTKVTPGKKVGVYEIKSRINPGNDVQYTGTNKYAFKPRVENALNQHWWITKMTKIEETSNGKSLTRAIYVLQSELNQRHWLTAGADNKLECKALKSKLAVDVGDPAASIAQWWHLVPIIREGYKDVFAIESMAQPGYYVKDPSVNNVGGFELVQEPNVMNLPADNEYLYFNIPWYHD